MLQMVFLPYILISISILIINMNIGIDYWFCYIAFIISLGTGSTSPSGHWFGGQHSWQSTWWLIKHFGRIISTTNSYSKSSRGGGILCSSVLWWRSDCQGQWSGYTAISRWINLIHYFWQLKKNNTLILWDKPGPIVLFL